MAGPTLNYMDDPHLQSSRKLGMETILRGVCPAEIQWTSTGSWSDRFVNTINSIKLYFICPAEFLKIYFANMDNAHFQTGLTFSPGQV